MFSLALAFALSSASPIAPAPAYAALLSPVAAATSPWEWMDNDPDGFWNNAQFDYLLEPPLWTPILPVPVLNLEPPVTTAISESVLKDDHPEAGGKRYKPLVQSTMWIKPFDVEEERQHYLDADWLFPWNWHSSAQIAFNELLRGTNALGDDGSPDEPDDWTDREFRCAADLQMEFVVRDGKICEWRHEISVRSGAEPIAFPGLGVPVFGHLSGLVKGQVTGAGFSEDDSKVQLVYSCFGRPHKLARQLFNGVLGDFRTSEWIWQQVLVTVTVTGDTGCKVEAELMDDSLFPSDTVYVDDKPVDSSKQQEFINLWQTPCPTHGANMAGRLNYVTSSGICAGQLPFLPANPETCAGASSEPSDEEDDKESEKPSGSDH